MPHFIHSRITLSLISIFALAALACNDAAQAPATEPPAAEPPATEPPAAHVIVVSVDGLLPAAYLDPDAHGLEVPTLRMLHAEGAYSPGMQSVYPSVTYPAHTSMVTGQPPAMHGIGSNRSWDPFLRNQAGWNWYAEDIRVPTIWQAAEQAGLRTALVNWPVTVGAQADWVVPEYWRAGTPDDVKLARALSTPGLLDAVADAFPDFWDGFTPPDVADKASIDIAIHLLRTGPPELMLVHTWMVDEYQHRNGAWSEEANARVEEADAQLARLIGEVKHAGIWDQTILVVLSDHGFAPIHTRVRPGAHIAQLGLVTLDGDTITDWRAIVHVNSAQAYVFVQDEADQEAKDALLRTFTALAETPGAGIGTVLTREQIAARGGDAGAFLALDAAPGYSFMAGYTGDARTEVPGQGDHGYDPALPEMQTALLVYGPRVRPGMIEGARLVDVAPTIAAWLDLPFPEVQGQPLPVELAASH